MILSHTRGVFSTTTLMIHIFWALCRTRLTSIYISWLSFLYYVMIVQLSTTITIWCYEIPSLFIIYFFRVESKNKEKKRKYRQLKDISPTRLAYNFFLSPPPKKNDKNLIQFINSYTNISPSTHRSHLSEQSPVGDNLIKVFFSHSCVRIC